MATISGAVTFNQRNYTMVDEWHPCLFDPVKSL
jgi:hypothetical protein